MPKRRPPGVVTAWTMGRDARFKLAGSIYGEVNANGGRVVGLLRASTLSMIGARSSSYAGQGEGFLFCARSAMVVRGCRDGGIGSISRRTRRSRQHG